jgi:D-hydroxyproline dehydrogenase subunit alpha
MAGGLRVPDLLVVGAGPAGLAAAERAASLGLEVLVADENMTAGGQYYRQPAPGLVVDGLDAQQRRGRERIERVARVASLRLGTSVYGLDRGRAFLERGGQAEAVEPGAILLATGAHDRPVAFPGWTLPGVMSAGAAQTFLTGQRVRPGRRAVVAGTGPFILVTAAHLLQAGVEVVEVVEAASPETAIRHLPRSARYLGRYPELAGYVLPILRARTRIATGTIVAGADGADRVEVVRVRPTAAAGGRGSRDREIRADLLCVGYGFSAPTELARLAGCGPRWDAAMRQAVPVCDDWQETTTESVFVAGEVSGLAGAEAAQVEGELAAVGAARRLGRLSDAGAGRLAEPLRRRLRRLRAFAGLLADLFPLPDVLRDLPDADTTVCRCQNVCYGQVLEAVRSGATTLNEVKTTTRSGMGWCQGRVCGRVLQLLLSGPTGTAFDEAADFTARSPIRPVPVAVMAALRQSPAAPSTGRVTGGGVLP